MASDGIAIPQLYIYKGDDERQATKLFLPTKSTDFAPSHVLSDWNSTPQSLQRAVTEI